MEKLNEVSLCETLTRCYENKNYKAIIVFEKWYEAQALGKELLEINRITSIPGVKSILIGSNVCRVSFANGSRIEMITLRNNFRGIKCNEIIYETDIDTEDSRIRNLLQCMLVPYKLKAHENAEECPATNAPKVSDKLREFIRQREASRRSEELDEFLGSFSIVQEQKTHD